MRLIDVHTHIFPEKIAEKTLSRLGGIIHYTPSTNGLKDGLIQSQKEAGIDLSVVLPVVTRVEQFESVNRFALTMQEGSLLSLGGIHPADENYKEHLRFIKASGLKGIKLHPDYQDMYFDDIRMKRLIAYASELDLIVVTHAGVDPVSPHDVHCKCRMIHDFVREVQPTKLVLAHMGIGSGADLEYLKECIIGESVYLDTAYMLQRIPKEELIYAFTHHDSDKIMFGTDCPWSSQKEDAEYFMNLEIEPELKEKIAWKNAAKLMEII